MVGLVGLPLFAQSAEIDKPNVVVVMADDLGPGDLGFYHRERTGMKEIIPTPNIDQLIREGMRFDDAHSAAPLCAPSRFGMLTGSYSYRNYQPYGVWGSWEKSGVEEGFTTSAKIMKAAGYATAFFGKSGMGGDYNVVDPNTAFAWKDRYRKYDLAVRTNGPNQWGFDYSFELPSGIQNHPFAFYENGKWMPLKPDSTWKMIGPKQNRYDVSRKHNDLEQIGDSNWDPRLAGSLLTQKARGYIERQAAASPDQPFFIYYCSQAVHIPHSPPEKLDGVKIAGSTPGPHGDMIHELDVQVGMLINALKIAGVYERTLFIFTSDNGGLAPDPAAEKLGHDPSNGWSGIKGAIREGGHRVPFIARWPGTIKPGTKSDATISALDVVATSAEVAGQKISQRQVMDSKNLIPLFTQAKGAEGNAVLVHYSKGGTAALRKGPWKLYIFGKNLKNLRPTHLYNLETNPSEDENKDLLNHPEQSERVDQMLKIFMQCLIKPTASL